VYDLILMRVKRFGIGPVYQPSFPHEIRRRNIQERRLHCGFSG